MPILRHNHEQEFTILPNSLIRNPELSLRDVGLLCYILSLPPDWEFSIRGLDAVIRRNGISSVRAGIAELEKQGYLIRTQKRGNSGKFQCSNWTVTDLPMMQLQDVLPKEAEPSSEKPISEKPMTEKPISEKPTSVNRTQTKNIRNKEHTNKEKREQKALSLPGLQDVKAYIQENGLQMDAEQFYDYYTARGWKLGDSPVADWTALARNWSRRQRKEGAAIYGNHDGGNEYGKNGLELPWKLGNEV